MRIVYVLFMSYLMRPQTVTSPLNAESNMITFVSIVIIALIL